MQFKEVLHVGGIVEGHWILQILLTVQIFRYRRSGFDPRPIQEMRQSRTWAFDHAQFLFSSRTRVKLCQNNNERGQKSIKEYSLMLKKI